MPRGPAGRRRADASRSENVDLNAVNTHIVKDLAPTGALRASINLGNPVLTQGDPEAPSGVTVEIARGLASRLDVPLELRCFKTARTSFEAMRAGEADICFLALEPARETELAFTAPYVIIEGVFAVPEDSTIATVAEVDREGVRVGVRLGSAYDLFLSRTLRRATVVRGDKDVGASLELGLEVEAGIRQALAAFVGGRSGFRLLDPRFMEIRQALGTTKTRAAATLGFLHSFIEELKASGFIAEALQRAEQSASIAPAEPESPRA